MSPDKMSQAQRESTLELIKTASRIINELGCSENLLESWMSHHLAAVVAASESPALSSEAQSLIVQLWNMKMQRDSQQIERDVNRAFAWAPEMTKEALNLVRTLADSAPVALKLSIADRIVHLSILRQYEKDLLYLWMAAEKLDESLSKSEESDLVVLFGDESLISRAVKRLQALDDRFAGIPESDLPAIGRLAVEELVLLNRARMQLLGAHDSE